MGHSPYDFVMNYSVKHRTAKNLNFVHRTFNSEDLHFFFLALNRIYTEFSSLEDCFLAKEEHDFLYHGIANFRKIFFNGYSDTRTQKHVSSPLNNSACKRILMFLRWMVRKNGVVDFGLWNKIQPFQLLCPLDVHSGTIARRLQLLQRTQNDWRAVVELTEALRQFDREDPVKYDFALFGLGVSKFFDESMNI